MYTSIIYFEAGGEEFRVTKAVAGSLICFEGLDCEVLGQAIWNKFAKGWQMVSLHVHDDEEPMLGSELCDSIIEHLSRFGVPEVKV